MPDAPLFITGASGFVGRAALRKFREMGGWRITCLVRRPDELRRGITPGPHWSYVQGDLTEESWCGQIPPNAVILHLAAATGGATASTHQDVNVRGTARLLEASRSADAVRFIFVSSIATTFEDVSHYHYARTKRRAEELVSDGDLDSVILRPTMIFGPNSPVQEGLTRLATSPIGIVFGSGQALVQPVHVDDVVSVLAELCSVNCAPAISGPVEVAGPDRVRMLELLRRIRSSVRGARGPFLRIPLQPVRGFLAALERVFPGHLPLTAGQLASFANDGTATPSDFVDRRQEGFRKLEEMIR